MRADPGLELKRTKAACLGLALVCVFQQTAASADVRVT